MGGLVEKVRNGNTKQIIDAIGEVVIGSFIILGGGLLLSFDANNTGIVALVSASIGAVVGHYYRTTDGKGGEKGG